MNAMAYHLEARAPFHFGLRGVGIESTAIYGPSDTLFSALCDTFRQQFGQATLEAFLADYGTAEPPLVLSSAFPYVPARRAEELGEWRPPRPFDPTRAIRFFPRPLEPPPGVPDLPETRKKVKRIAWVSEGVFRAWVGGENLEQHYTEGYLVQGGRVWLMRSEGDDVAGWYDEETDVVRLWAVGDVPRVTVDRQASASAVYQAGRVWFRSGGGLWLLMRWRSDWQKQGEEALQVLGDAGVGGERSAGHGLFRPHGPHTLGPLPSPQPGGHFVTLSFYYPTEDEVPTVLQGKEVGYRWQMRRGWMASPDVSRDAEDHEVRGGALRRKAVRMFDQGSILCWPDNGSIPGQLADVTPDAFDAHTVWRYGLAYAVGYRGQGGEG
jgi:CRISPR-associated protein Csm4